MTTAVTARQIPQYIDAWTHAVEAVRDLVAPLPEADWNRATECPGWSVRDVVSHLIGTELDLLGDPRPIHTLPRDLYHVVDEKSRHNEVQVDVRRCHTGPEQSAELDYVLIRRQRVLRDRPRGPEDEVLGLYGRPMRFGALLRFRAFDTWAHEQDLRRALGLPGNLDSPGAEVARDLLTGALPEVVAVRAEAPPRTVVALEVTGPMEFLRTVRVTEPGQATIDGSISLAPTVSLTTDWETYLRLACGRVRPDRAEVKVEGDTDLAAAILARFPVT